MQATATAEGLAVLFIRKIVQLHGIPQTQVTDRDTMFFAQFWDSFTEELRIKRCMSSAFHPQTEGQTERTTQQAPSTLVSPALKRGLCVPS